MTYDASELSLDGLIPRLNLLGHQPKLIAFLTTLVQVLAEYQQRFALAVQLSLASLQLTTIAHKFPGSDICLHISSLV